MLTFDAALWLGSSLAFNAPTPAVGKLLWNTVTLPPVGPCQTTRMTQWANSQSYFWRNSNVQLHHGMFSDALQVVLKLLQNIGLYIWYFSNLHSRPSGNKLLWQISSIQTANRESFRVLLFYMPGNLYCHIHKLIHTVPKNKISREKPFSLINGER